MTRRTLIALPLLTTPVHGTCLTQWIREASRTGVVAPARPSTADSENPDDWDPRDFPEHWWQCKDEDEEAKWWYANRDKLDRYFEENPVSPETPEWFERACARAELERVAARDDLRDLEAAIEKNAGKPLTDWDEAKRELDI